MGDTEFIRQQAESLRTLFSAQEKTRAILEAQEPKRPEPKSKKKKKVRSESNGSK